MAKLPSSSSPHTVTSSEVGELQPPAQLPSTSEERYVLGEEIGRGGLGRVLLARDAALGRIVAIKELHSPSPAARARFDREIRLTARLQHPAIVPVYDAGRWGDDEPFYAMRLVQGRNLREAIEQAFDVAARLALLPHAIAAADAIAYAHRQGIVHRDIKPSNVLVGELGETLVVDWGVAKAVNEPNQAGNGNDDDDDDDDDELGSNLTLLGSAVGTPAYMAPEQAHGHRDDGQPLSPRDLKAADVYALGSLLYHLLCGLPPWSEPRTPSAPSDQAGAGPKALGHGRAILEAVKRGPPPALHTRVKGVAEELLAIVDNAMARSPRDRYRSAEELAADLRRFQTGQLVKAHRYSLQERLVRFIRRFKAAVATALLAFFLIVVVSVIAVRSVVRERDVAQERTRQLTLVQASSALDKDPTASLAWLKTLQLPELSDDDELRFRAVAADAAARGVARQLIDFDIKIEHLVAAPTGHQVFIATDRTLWVWDIDAAQIVGRFAADDPLEVRFNDDGSRALTRGRQGTLRVFPGLDQRGSLLSEDSAPITTFVGDHGWTNDLAVRAKLGALASVDGLVRVFDLAHPQAEAQVVAHHAKAVESVDFSPNGSLLASGGADGLVRVVRLRDRVELVHLQLDKGAGWVRFVDDGHALVFTDAGGAVSLLKLVDAQEGSPHPPMSLGGRELHIDDFILRPDGKAVAAGYHDGTIVVFDLQRESRVELRGHSDELVGMAWSKDGKRIASGGLDRSVRVWDIAHASARVFEGHSGIIESVSFTADGRFVISGGQDGKVRVWDVNDDGSRAFSGHSDDIYMVRASTDGRVLATAGKDKTVRLWQRDNGQSQLVATLPHVAYSVAFSNDGRWLAASGYGPTVDVWPLSNGQAQLEGHRVLEGHSGSVWRVAFSPDSRFLTSASADGAARAWDTTTWQGRQLHHHDSEGALFVATSPDSRLAATTGMDSTARISMLEPSTTTTPTTPTTTTTLVLRGHADRLLRLAFSPDSKTIATGSWDRTVKLWSTDSGALLSTFQNDGRIRSLVFTRDGRSLAVGADDNSVRLIDLHSGATHVLGHHNNYVRELELSADGKMLASLGWDESVRLWDVDSGTLLGLERRDDVIMSTVFSADGHELVLAGYPKVVDVRPLSSAASLPLLRADLRTWLEQHTEVTINMGNEASSARPAQAP